MENIRHRLKYRLAKERISKALKRDNVQEISGTTGKNARLTVHLKVGKSLIYRGKIATPLHKFIFKKRYCKDEMPKVVDNYII